MCATRGGIAMHNWPLLLPTCDLSSFFWAQTALHAPPEVAFAMRSWPLLLTTFSLLSFPSFAFDPLQGFLRVSSSFYGQRSVTAAWATPSPWSI